ncbi:MAG: ATP-dependent RecD-like DNA helicase [Acutalibacteraceae bacterium]
MDNEKELLQIECIVEDIIYRNEENGYTVIDIDSNSDISTAVGIMPDVKVGVSLKLYGEIKNHPTYGIQFSVSAFSESMPKTVAGILKYLSSGAVRGVGPSTASRLVKNFGEKTLDVMENEPERVALIKGISIDKAQDISSQMQSLTGIRELMLYLTEYDIKPSQGVKIWKAFGERSIEKIKEDPFILCSENINIPFEKVSEIAKAQGKPLNFQSRIRMGIVYILRHNQLNGHTCLPKNTLLKISSDYLEVTLEETENILYKLVNEGSLCEEDFGDIFIFTPDMQEYEAYISARMIMMARFPSPKIMNIDSEIKKIEKEENIEYADMQKEAIKEAVNKGMLILTGGPGTGKTTTLKAIIKLLKNNGQKVLLCAPTGRAAQRMTTLTGEEAKTIHRLLEVAFDKEDKPVFKRNESHTLKCDAIIVDEVSMVDVGLFSSLVKALPLGVRLILVGDSDQLPSVGPGNVLNDLISSNIIPKVELNTIFRQSLESLIVTNAHKIVKGELPDISKTDNDFFFLHTNSFKECSDLIVDLVSRRLPSSYGFSPIDDIEVLTPSRKGDLGTFELNKRLQETINPKSKDKPEISLGNRIFRLGDKVMQNKNNYDLLFEKDNGELGEGIFNGEIGTIEKIDKLGNILKVRFDDKLALYEKDNILDLEHAYATTVHKSQGNEFNAVIIPMFKTAPGLLTRNLLYTAVTRARQLLILAGSEEVVKIMVQNNKSLKRYTGLAKFMEQTNGNI